MRFVKELVAAAREMHPDDHFFSEFETSLLNNSLKKSYYEAYERALRCLNEESWVNLRTKTIAHFHESRRLQLKSPFFDQLNDVFAYRWLVNREFSNITILAEKQGSQLGKCPDITFHALGRLCACDVKTIGTSDAELDRGQSESYSDRSVYQVLAKGFFKKIDDAIVKGTEQIRQYSDTGLVFILVHSDDYASTFQSEHRIQLSKHIRKHSVPVVVKFGIHGQSRIERVTSLPSKLEPNTSIVA